MAPSALAIAAVVSASVGQLADGLVFNWQNTADSKPHAELNVSSRPHAELNLSSMPQAELNGSAKPHRHRDRHGENNDASNRRDCRVLGLQGACRKSHDVIPGPADPVVASFRKETSAPSRLHLSNMHEVAAKTQGKVVGNVSKARGNVSQGARNSSATPSTPSGPVTRSNAAQAFMDGEQAAGCPAKGHTVFLHVMKTAGLAVDAFLECQGNQDGWAIMHHDGKEMKVQGNQDCLPSVCTLHGSVLKASQPDECGEAFANASVFTVIRDPVERVWSFYNYLKDQKAYTPYQTHELSEIMENWGSTDLNLEVEPRDRCSFCHTQLYNPMVLYNFIGPTASAKLQSCNDNPLCVPDESALSEALEEAKSTLRSLKAIYVMEEDLGAFGSSFLSDPDLTPILSDKACELPHKNPSQASEVKADNTTIGLIRKLNWADIELYEYAKTLPNRVTKA